MIEGQLGQGSASAQTEGFLLAYEQAGKNLGGVTATELAKNKTEAKQDGTQEIEVVFGLLVDGSQILHKSYDRCHNFSWCRRL